MQDFPDDDVIRDMDLQSEFDILGLFQGSPLAQQVSNHSQPEPTMVFLYRRPMLDYWAENRGTLGDLVRHVIVHEIGHHFGLSDDDMEAIEERDLTQPVLLSRRDKCFRWASCRWNKD